MLLLFWLRQQIQRENSAISLQSWKIRREEVLAQRRKEEKRRCLAAKRHKRHKEERE
jgi:hypothetical protein